jgi:hypothetical protein
LVAGITGSDVERAMSNLDAAEATLLRLAPTSFLRGQMPSLLTCVRHHLPANDPRRVRMEDLARHATNGGFQDYERGVIVAARRGAASEARREIMRVRSFRNVLFVAAFLLVLGRLPDRRVPAGRERRP